MGRVGCGLIWQAPQCLCDFVTSLLFSHYLSPPSSLSSLFVEALGAISRSFGGRQCCARAWRHHRVSLVCPHWASCFHLNPQLWIPLLTMSITGHPQREQECSYLSYFHHVVLGLDEVDRLVHTVTEELGTRGLTTAFLFSSHALDINSSRVRRLIQAFLCTCVSFPASDAERTWQEEARFAALPEVAMCLRSGLARVLRVSGGNAVRGLLSWDSLGTRTSSGVRPNLVSHFLRHVFI